MEGTKRVILFRHRVEEHRRALTAMFGAGSVEVRPALYSVAELEQLAQRVEAERDWFPTVRARLVGAEPDEPNKVRVRYLAADESVEPRIRAHFGDPPWLQLRRYGALPWTGPRGDLEVWVLDRAGRPVWADCVARPTQRSVEYHEGPRQTTDAAGRCPLAALPATAHVVEVSYVNRHDKVVKVTKRVRVRPRRVTPVIVVVDR